MTVDVVGGDVAGGQDRRGAWVSEPSLGRSRILGLGPDGELRSSRKQLNAEPREYAHSDLYSYFFTLSLLNVIFLENFYLTSIYTVQKWLMILFFLYILNIKHVILNPWPLVKKDLSFRLFLAFGTELLIDDIHCMLVKDASLSIICDLFHCKDKYEQIVWIPLENPPNVYFLVSCCFKKVQESPSTGLSAVGPSPSYADSAKWNKTILFTWNFIDTKSATCKSAQSKH